MTGRSYWADPQHAGYLVCRPHHADTVPDHCAALVDDVVAHEHWHLNVEARYDALRTVVLADTFLRAQLKAAEEAAAAARGSRISAITAPPGTAMPDAATLLTAIGDCEQCADEWPTLCTTHADDCEAWWLAQ